MASGEHAADVACSRDLATKGDHPERAMDERGPGLGWRSLQAHMLIVVLPMHVLFPAGSSTEGDLGRVQAHRAEPRAAAEARRRQLQVELTQLDSEHRTLLKERSLAVTAGADENYLRAVDGELGANEERAEVCAEEIAANQAVIRSHPLQIDIGVPSEGGDDGYYEKRAEDFQKRNPGAAPPDYYLSYGDKYLKRFNALRPELSRQGQSWQIRTKWQLQRAMEDAIARDPAGFAALELVGSAFRAFAFATHLDAYMNGGLSELSWRDRLVIAATPDPWDILSQEGLSQIGQAGFVVATEGLWGRRDWRFPELNLIGRSRSIEGLVDVRRAAGSGES